MDFEELLAQAGTNAKQLNRKVLEAKKEIDLEKRQSLERLSAQKKLEREDLRKRIPPKPEKPKFVIPKKNNDKNSDVSKDGIKSFLLRQEEGKKQRLIQRQQEKEELIRLRLEANGGKANKKISKHFGKSPMDLQMNYSNNSEYIEKLRKQEEREQEEQERLADMYRQGVYSALSKKNQVVEMQKSNKLAKPTVNSIKQQRSLSIINPQTDCDSKSKPKSSLSNGSTNAVRPSTSRTPSCSAQSLALKKRKGPVETTDFNTLMQKAEQNRLMDPDELAMLPLQKQPKKPLQDASVTEGRSLAPIPKKKMVEQRKGVASVKNNLPDKYSSSSKMQSDKKSSSSSTDNIAKFLKPQGIPPKRKLPEPIVSTKQAPPPKESKQQVVVDPEHGVIRPKRILPGDIRYQNNQFCGASSSLPSTRTQQMTPKVTSGTRVLNTGDRSIPSSAGDRSTPSSTRTVSSCGASGNKMSSRGELNHRRESSSSSRTNASSKPSSSSLEELDRRRKELEQLEKELSRKQAMIAEAEKARNHALPLNRNETSLAKIKHEERMRYEMSQRYKHSPQRSNRFHNDSDEEDDDEDVEDEEYDSEMDDFIDDSAAEELQREDFEESLRLINPHYDKKKWKIRERMISDRDMDARFHDVEREEMRSAKYGYYEDVMEARRGSKALS